MGQWGGLIYLILPILLIVLIISRTRKQQRQIVAVQNKVEAGTTVMMTSGIFGEVVSIDDDGIIELEVAPGVRTRWTRQAVARVITGDHTPDQVAPEHHIELPDDAIGRTDPPADQPADRHRPNQADPG